MDMGQARVLVEIGAREPRDGEGVGEEICGDLCACEYRCVVASVY